MKAPARERGARTPKTDRGNTAGDRRHASDRGRSLSANDWNSLRTAALRCRRPKELPMQHPAWFARVPKRRRCPDTPPESSSLRHHVGHRARARAKGHESKSKSVELFVDLDLPRAIVLAPLVSFGGLDRPEAECQGGGRDVGQVRDTERQLRRAIPAPPKERPHMRLCRGRQKNNSPPR